VEFPVQTAKIQMAREDATADLAILQYFDGN
jgi:hypothetical protein